MLHADLIIVDKRGRGRNSSTFTSTAMFTWRGAGGGAIVMRLVRPGTLEARH